MPDRISGDGGAARQDSVQPSPAESKPAPTAAAADHDAGGLEVARWVAGGLRGLAGRRPRSTSRRSGRLPAEMSGAHPDERDPAPLGNALDRLVLDSGWGTDVAVHGVFGRWPLIVGSDVAAHCNPESFQDGRVTVRTDSTAWAAQLRLLAPTVVRRLNEDLGHGTVVGIDVVGPELPSWRRGRRAVRGGRGPRDTYG